MGRIENDNNVPPPPPLALAAASSDSELAISLSIGGKEVMVTAGDTPSRISPGSCHIPPGIILLVTVHWRWYQQIRGGPGGGKIFPGIVWGGGGGVKVEGG